MISHIYFIDCGNNLIKIGKANNIEKRMKQLQTGNPYKLKLIADIKCNEHNVMRLESALHYRYKHWHYRGEWYLKNEMFWFDKHIDNYFGEFRIYGKKPNYYAEEFDRVHKKVVKLDEVV